EVKVSKDDNKGYLTIEWSTTPSFSDWFCYATMEARVVHAINGLLSVRKRVSSRVNKHTNIGQIINFDWNMVTLLRNGFLRDGGIMVEAWIEVHRSSTGPPSLSDYDFFTPSLYSVVVLTVEEKKLHVSKQILAHHSSYFEKLFFGDFKEAKQSEITLTDIVLEEFLIVLRRIYNGGTING
ncbi:hypothetical protein PFISCL1PPCAC_21050, partial [Pristionchus fissidentatus]